MRADNPACKGKKHIPQDNFNAALVYLITSLKPTYKYFLNKDSHQH